MYLIYFEKCGKVSNGRKILPANVISGLYPQIMLQNKPGMLEVQFRGSKDIFYVWSVCPACRDSPAYFVDKKLKKQKI